MKNFDETEWARTKSLLREHLTAPPLAHPDFVNHRVLEEIERSRKKPRPAIFPLRWLVWSGAAAIACAALLTMTFLPREGGRRSHSEFISQVVSARAEMPQLSVSEFRVPDGRGVVIWIEGADYIPAENSVR
ncbi:MAG TPA: hypothetical protein VIS96_02935 [Terrimicrobiaceae bacterium]